VYGATLIITAVIVVAVVATVKISVAEFTLIMAILDAPVAAELMYALPAVNTEGAAAALIAGAAVITVPDEVIVTKYCPGTSTLNVVPLNHVNDNVPTSVKLVPKGAAAVSAFGVIYADRISAALTCGVINSTS
jgi:hypothetical protein